MGNLLLSDEYFNLSVSYSTIRHMSGVKNLWVAHKLLLLVLAVYAVGGLLLLLGYRRQINPDGVAYLSIAHDYARGYFHAALNAYWGPLLSWLLAPFWLIHRDPLVGEKLLDLVAGGITITMTYLLLRRWRLSRSVQFTVLATLVPIVWYWTLPAPVTPDGLVVAVFAVYLWLLTKNFQRPWLRALLLGIVIAIGFFTKAFMLPFFVVHLLAYNAWHWHTESKDWRPFVASVGISFGVAIVLIAPWAAALSSKYHAFTLSTAGSFNLRILDPQQPGQPVSYRGLLPLPNTSALSAWEDPSSIPTPDWSPISSFSHLHDYWNVIIGNIWITGVIFLGFSVFSLALLSYTLLANFGSRPKHRVEIGVTLSVILIYSAGYLLTNREERYYWPAFWGLLILAGLVWDGLKPRWRQSARYAALFLLILSVVYLPIKQLMDNHNRAVYPWQEAMALQPLIPAGSRVASDTFSTIDYCYFLQVPCYGAINPKFSNQTNERQLANYHITDVLLFNLTPTQPKPKYLANYHEVPSPAGSARLFELNKASSPESV